MASTLEQKTNVVGFPKAGELIEITGAHELEAQDRAVLNLLYQHAHDSGRLAEIGAEWELPLAALRPSRHESNDRLHSTLDRLLRVVVTVPIFSAKDGEPRLVKTHLFDFFNLSANERAANSNIRFGLPKQLQPVLAGSSRWGRIKAATVCAMTSKYAIALYELVQLRAGMDRCVETFPIERFRELMGVPPGKLLRGPDFERRVIEPAVLEVNGLSDIAVQAVLVRAHGRAPITAVTLAWWLKKGHAFRATLQELNQPKQGRMARLRSGSVERQATGDGRRRAPKPRRVSRAVEGNQQLDTEDVIKGTL